MKPVASARGPRSRFWDLGNLELFLYSLQFVTLLRRTIEIDIWGYQLDATRYYAERSAIPMRVRTIRIKYDATAHH
jgi:hypothetical protein